MNDTNFNYSMAHKRVRRARGQPSEYACFDCGGPANEWTLNVKDTDRIHTQQHGVAKGMTFSWDVNDYEARCTRCHHRFDAICEFAPPRTHCRKGHALLDGVTHCPICADAARLRMNASRRKPSGSAPRSLDDADRLRVRDLVDRGYSLREVSRLFDISITNAFNIVASLARSKR